MSYQKRPWATIDTNSIFISSSYHKTNTITRSMDILHNAKLFLCHLLALACWVSIDCQSNWTYRYLHDFVSMVFALLTYNGCEMLNGLRYRFAISHNHSNNQCSTSTIDDYRDNRNHLILLSSDICTCYISYLSWQMWSQSTTIFYENKMVPKFKYHILYLEDIEDIINWHFALDIRCIEHLK